MRKVFSKKAAPMAIMAAMTVLAIGCAIRPRPIFVGAFRGDTTLIDRSLQKNPKDVLARNNNGDTALHLAARAGNAAVVRLLLYRGARVNARRKYEVLVLLSDLYPAGATFFFRAWLDRMVWAPVKNGGTALHLAAQYGHTDVVRVLLEHGARVDMRDPSGWRPLHWAAYTGRTAIARLLITARADVNAKTYDGRTPLRLAIQKKRHDVARLLIGHGGRK